MAPFAKTRGRARSSSMICETASCTLGDRGVDPKLGMLGRLVGSVDAGEAPDLSRACARVETLGISALAFLARVCRRTPRRTAGWPPCGPCAGARDRRPAARSARPPRSFPSPPSAAPPGRRGGCARSGRRGRTRDPRRARVGCCRRRGDTPTGRCRPGGVRAPPRSSTCPTPAARSAAPSRRADRSPASARRGRARTGAR